MTIAEKLTQVAENVPKVYTAGKEAEKTEFWDSYLANVTKRQYLFAGEGWNNDTFKPTKDIVFKGNALRAFCGNAVTNLKEALGQIKLDFSEATSVAAMFSEAKTTHLPELDFSNCTTHTNIFYYSSPLVSVDKITFGKGSSLTGNFDFCSNLENVIFGGTVSVSGLDLHWSAKLNKASITSIINALSASTSGLSVTFSKTAVNTAFGIDIDDETTFPEGSEYYTLRHSKDNWTVNYI